jgi:expansin (peptidoglycan-binding protein)
MQRSPGLFRSWSGLCGLVVALALGCQTGEVGETDGGGSGKGGTTGTAGSTNPGTAGTQAHGGTTGSGNSGDGGAAGSTVGTAGTGGTGTGATAGTNGGTTGTAGTGGMAGAGGSMTGTAGTGGAAGRGGNSGAAGMGGNTGAAGRGGTTGTAGTSGTTGRGGTTGGGGSTGAGGSPPTQCTLQNHSGNGSFTWYYFGQGTARDGSGYRTACGYYGTENGQTDTIENIATMSPASATYFAAIPGQNGFDSKSHCGECVSITGQNGTTIIATVIDECPYGNDGGNSACAANAQGHLDLSKAAFDRLGYSVGNPSGTNWKFVPCPVSGNVKVRFKSGNNNEFFVENVITPIASVSVNGQNASRQSYGAWHVGSAISTPATLNMTDMAGRMLTVTLNGGTSNQDTGSQFPACQ